MKGVGDKIGLEAMPGVDAYVRERNLEVPPLDQPLIPDDLHYAGYSWTQDILVIAMPGIFSLRFSNKHPQKNCIPPIFQMLDFFKITISFSIIHLNLQPY